jgi:hypothetical protein
MTEAPASPPARAARRPGARRRHAAAATRLFIGGAALAGTLDLIALMGAGADLDAAEPVATPDPLAGAVASTAPPTAPATTPETIVIVRRHVVVAGSGTTSVRSTRSPSTPPASSPAPTPAAAPAPAPPPAPVTTTKGS